MGDGEIGGPPVQVAERDLGVQHLDGVELALRRQPEGGGRTHGRQPTVRPPTGFVSPKQGGGRVRRIEPTVAVTHRKRTLLATVRRSRKRPATVPPPARTRGPAGRRPRTLASA